MADQDSSARRANFLSYLLGTVTLVMVFAGSVLLCGGMAFAFIGIVLGMGLFGLLHYLLWGQAYNREVEGERLVAEFRQLVEGEGEDGPGEVFKPEGRF